MRRKFTLEFDDEGTGANAYSPEEMEMFLISGAEKFIGALRSQKMNFKVSHVADKPLISNVLPFTKITLDHTKDKGFHMVKDQIENEKFPLRLQGIAWERAYESEDDTLREQE